MKPKLLLYITSDDAPGRNAVAATLAWACQSIGWFFEVYYDAYRLGEHYGGGDPDLLPQGSLTGGVVVGAHHHERLYLLLHRFDTLVVTQGNVAFDAALRNLNVRRLSATTCEDLYEQVFAALNFETPLSALIIDRSPSTSLQGLDAYTYPEIVMRRSLGFEASQLTEATASWLKAHDVNTVYALWLGQAQQERVEQALMAAHPAMSVTHIDRVAPADQFQTVTERLARRCHEQFRGGWILADPVTISSWLPEAVRERRLSIYGKPQREIIQQLSAELRATESAVLGRQYEDADFFDLSALGVAFQLIDPNRPPFPVLRHASYDWTGTRILRVPEAQEPTDAQLVEWARAGRILSSVIFWTGMIRELENLPRIIDLVALTRLKAGIALTLPALEYQPEGALEMLQAPLEMGGVFPHVEVLLASCGLGAAIESCMPPGRLAAYLAATYRRMDELAIPQEWRPRGWWTTMDPKMIHRAHPRAPITPTLERGAPFLRLRYASSALRQVPHTATPAEAHGNQASANGAAEAGHTLSRRRRIGAWVRRSGFESILAPYRPYELYEPGPLNPDIVATARAAGLRYLFSKAGFGARPQTLARTDDFIALNYTVGRWDGWTPFETINDIHDLRTAERRLLATGKPGWLVGTLDSCLWTFTGPIWQRGAELYRIASFLAAGGDSTRLINVTPNVVARYARIVTELEEQTA